jgi:hypothetical protein
MNKTIMVAAGLMIGAFSSVAAQPSSSLLQSLPTQVQRDIEETRTYCSSSGSSGLSVTEGDSGLIRFLLGSREAVLVDPIILCGGCLHGYSCSNRGTRSVDVYARFGKVWSKVPLLDKDATITGDIFVSFVPRSTKLNALVVSLYIGNKECPTRRAETTSAQSWEARSCVVRWNGTKFTFKPL